MKISILYVFLSIVPLCLFAQSSKPSIAELLQQLSTSNDEKEKIALQLQLAKKYQYQKPDSALHYSDLVLTSANKLELIKEVLEVLEIKGIIAFQKGNFPEAEKQFNEALSFAEKHQQNSLAAKSIFWKGRIAQEQANYDLTLQYFFAADSIYRKIGMKKNVAQTQLSIGQVFLNTGDLQKADAYYLEGLRIAKEEKNFIGEQIAYFYLIKSKRLLNDAEGYKKYMDLYLKGKKNMFAKNTSFLQQHINVMTIGESTENVKKQIQESIDYHRKIDYPFGVILSQFMLAEHYDEKKAFQKSYPVYQDILQLSDSIGHPLLRKTAYFRIYQTNKLEENWREALEAFEKYEEAEFKILEKEKLEAMEELNVQYETAQKEAQIQRQQFEIQQKTQQRNTFIGASFLLSLLGLSIYFFLQQRIRKNQIIANQKQQIQAQKISELQKTQRLLNLDAMITGQEQERKRIAKDLHDGLGGLLATVKVQFNAIQREMDKLAEMKVYQRANEMLDNACVEVRKIAHNMMPDALMKLGLVEAVQDMAEGINANGNLQIDVQNMGFQSLLSETQQIMLYRIVQELLNNILKHSQAKNVIIQFAAYNDELSITIEDDGKGFDIEAMKAKGGLGLKSIESRTSYLEGKWEMDSEIGVGTTTVVSIPLH